MNRPKTMLGSSVSILIVAVIAIVAFVRGKWELPLLIAAFVLWGIWLVWKLLVPAWREARRQRDNALLADWTPMEAPGTAAPDPALANLLLLHVNHRISGCLLSYYPNARWEWLVNDPVQFVVSGGTARICVYGIPAYEYADITLDSKAQIDVKLLNVAPLGGVQPEEKTGKQPISPQVWFETQGKEILERMVMELNSRGHNMLYLKEDGSICIQKEEGGEETPQGSFQSFPEKVYWPGLVEVLRQNGLAAMAMDHFIQVAW